MKLKNIKPGDYIVFKEKMDFYDLTTYIIHVKSVEKVKAGYKINATFILEHYLSSNYYSLANKDGMVFDEEEEPQIRKARKSEISRFHIELTNFYNRLSNFIRSQLRNFNSVVIGQILRNNLLNYVAIFLYSIFLTFLN